MNYWANSRFKPLCNCECPEITTDIDCDTEGHVVLDTKTGIAYSGPASIDLCIEQDQTGSDEVEL